jgi:hypothetical protein
MPNPFLDILPVEEKKDEVEMALELALTLLKQAKIRKKEEEFRGLRAMGLLSEFQVTAPIGGE